MHILFSLIDKTRGNAINFVTGYVEKPTTWLDFRYEFLLMYSTTRPILRPVAQAYFNLKLQDNNMFVDLTRLEALCRAIAEAHLGIQDEFSVESVIYNKAGPRRAEITIPTASSEGTQTEVSASTATTSSTATTTSAATSTGGATAPRPTITLVDPQPMVSTDINLLDFVQNLLMHISLSAQVHHKVYDRLAKLSPKQSVHRFIAEVNSGNNTYKSQKPMSNPPPMEPMWKVSPGTQTKKPGQPQQNTQGRAPMVCYNCGREGHTRRECPKCGYCKQGGHTAKLCQKRIAESKGKWCDHCQMADSHNTDECRKRKSRRRRGNIRRVQPGNSENQGTTGFDSRLSRLI